MGSFVHRIRQISAFQVFAICIGSALSSLDTAIQPIWVAGFIKGGVLTASTTGWLGSGELLLIACSTFAVSGLGQRLNPRVAAIGAALLMTIGNAIAASSKIEILIAGRMLSGLGTGTLTACAIVIASRREGAQRVLALMQVATLSLVSTIYLLSPTLVSHHGTGGLFELVSWIGVLATLALSFWLPDAPLKTETAIYSVGPRWIAPVLCCIGMAIVAAGITTVATYIVIIGNDLGFSAQAMGNVLAIAFPFATLGPVAAHVLGERAGLLRPLLFGLTVVTLGFFFIVSAASPTLLCIYGSVQGMAAYFYVAYALAFIGRLEPSGRFAAAAPAFVLLGSAVGPKLGSELIGFKSHQPLAVVAAACVGIGILLFSWAGWLTTSKRRENDSGKPVDCVVG